MTTVFDLSLEMMRLVTDVMTGTATEGGKHYLKDIRGLKVQPNEYYDGGTLWIRSGAHVGKALPVLSHLNQKVTFDPLESALCAQQVETATAAGTVTGTGNATVIVTAAGMPNSPKTVSVAVTNLDSASVVGEKIRTALGNDADVKSFFEIGGSGTGVILTAKIARANDATMNVSIDNGTCTGLTPALTSANTTAGSVGPRYALATGAFPWEQVMSAIQTALDLTWVWGHDDSLTGDGETHTFTLPAGVSQVKEVRLERGSIPGYMPISNHWSEELGELVFDYSFCPMKDDVIHFYFHAKHAELTDYETEINPEINREWLVLEAAKQLLFWGAPFYEKRKEFMIEDRINLVMSMQKGMRARVGSPSVVVKAAGGGRGY